MALLGHAAMSELSPLCAQKRKLNLTTIWDRAGNLLPCADRRCGVVGLIIGSVQPKCQTQMESR